MCVEVVELWGMILVVGEGLNLFLVGVLEVVEGFYVVLYVDVCFVDMWVKISLSEY